MSKKKIKMLEEIVKSRNNSAAVYKSDGWFMWISVGHQVKELFWNNMLILLNCSKIRSRCSIGTAMADKQHQLAIGEIFDLAKKWLFRQMFQKIFFLREREREREKLPTIVWDAQFTNTLELSAINLTFFIIYKNKTYNSSFIPDKQYDFWYTFSK